MSFPFAPSPSLSFRERKQKRGRRVVEGPVSFFRGKKESKEKKKRNSSLIYPSAPFDSLSLSLSLPRFIFGSAFARVDFEISRIGWQFSRREREREKRKTFSRSGEERREALAGENGKVRFRRYDNEQAIWIS